MRPMLYAALKCSAMLWHDISNSLKNLHCCIRYNGLSSRYLLPRHWRFSVVLGCGLRFPTQKMRRVLEGKHDVGCIHSYTTVVVHDEQWVLCGSILHITRTAIGPVLGL